jgi:hypothetical protein
VQPVRAKTKYNGFYAPAACYQAMTVIEEDLADDGPDGASTEEEDGGDVFEPAPLGMWNIRHPLNPAERAKHPLFSAPKAPRNFLAI